jgi:hypothetical protein
MRAGAKLLNVVAESGGGAGALRLSPSLLVLLFAGLLVEGGDALACLGTLIVACRNRPRRLGLAR